MPARCDPGYLQASGRSHATGILERLRSNPADRHGSGDKDEEAIEARELKARSNQALVAK